MTIIRGLVWGTALFAIGCSGGNGGVGPETTPTESALQEVSDLIRSVSNTTGRPPARASDFNKLESIYPNGVKAVKSGDVVVLWGAAVAGEGNLASAGEKIVAYEKNAPTQGGFVLFVNGKVKKMTSAEFAAAPKAK
ncbi:MAG TPA: hypothetical protein VGJ05_16720 [Fimbriiglobus sp.]|jgi:hypothetical protein